MEGEPMSTHPSGDSLDDPTAASPLFSVGRAGRTARAAMTKADLEGLVSRIFRGRRSTTPTDEPDIHPGEREPDRVELLEARVAHLEQLVEGLQDSVHRESERHAKMLAELQAQVDPGTMNASLAEGARNRGLSSNKGKPRPLARELGCLDPARRYRGE